MQRPKINKMYLFVRTIDNRIEHAEFVRYEDGSASYVIEGQLEGVEEDPNAWKSVTTWFENNGYIESNEAKATGLIPKDWTPEKVILPDLR